MSAGSNPPQDGRRKRICSSVSYFDCGKQSFTRLYHPSFHPSSAILFCMKNERLAIYCINLLLSIYILLGTHVWSILPTSILPINFVLYSFYPFNTLYYISFIPFIPFTTFIPFMHTFLHSDCTYLNLPTFRDLWSSSFLCLH